MPPELIDSFCTCIKSIDWVASLQNWFGIFSDFITIVIAGFAIYEYILWKRKIGYGYKYTEAQKLLTSAFEFGKQFINLLKFDNVFIMIVNIFSSTSDIDEKLNSLFAFSAVLALEIEELEKVKQFYESNSTVGCVLLEESSESIEEIEKNFHNLFKRIKDLSVLLSSISAGKHPIGHPTQEYLNTPSSVEIFSSESRKTMINEIRDNLSNLQSIINKEFK